MSSFNNLFNRMEALNEAKTSPYAAAHSSFGGVTKQMRAGGLSSAPLDTIKFIREILFNLDVISEEELQVVKSAKGFTGKKQAMLAVLRANQDAINAEINALAATQYVNFMANENDLARLQALKSIGLGQTQLDLLSDVNKGEDKFKKVFSE